MINLGDKVIDTVSGFTGIAISEHNYLNGCTRITIQPVIDKDGKLPETETFDEPQLKVIQSAAVPRGPIDTGGPDKYMPKSRPGE